MKRVTIIGAGVVGICTALYLQREGHDVTLVDPAPPASGCSFGNGGLIQSAACVPIATPSVLRAVPRMLLDSDQPLVVHWRYLPRLAPYLLRFLAAARPGRVEEISIALARLLSIALPSWRPLIADAGVGDLVQPTGELHIYASEATFNAARASHELRRRRGTRVEILQGDEVRQLAPALDPIYRRAAFLPGPEQTLDPYHFSSHLADYFVRSGGTLLQERVDSIVLGKNGPVGIRTNAGVHSVDELVVAAGAYSKRFAAELGSYVPLDTERGYHLMLPNAGVKLSVPLMSGDFRFALVQMTGGIRLVGTAELSRLDNPPDFARAERLLKLAQRILPGLNGEGRTSWMGHRPSLPDSLPVVSRSPRYPNAYFAFGHGHLGLTLAAATGRLIADLVARREPATDTTALHIDRFRRFSLS